MSPNLVIFYGFCLFYFSGGSSTFGAQMSLSEAADAILGTDDTKNGTGPNPSMMGNTGNFDTSPGAVAKNLLGKITMRKASIFSVSSIGSFVEKRSCSSTEELYPNGQKSKYIFCGNLYPFKGQGTNTLCEKKEQNVIGSCKFFYVTCG